MTPESALTPLADRLGHPFGDIDLLWHALTHRSWCAEHPEAESNERLEFLGDAVLGMVVTDHIYTGYPTLPEGQLAKLRASVVSAVALAQVARELQVGEALRLGKGEIASGGRDKQSILADAMEAVIGAVYIDGGFTEARAMVLQLFGPRIEDAAARPGVQDFKTRLQELAARHFTRMPVYRIDDDGPDHDKRFFATVTVGGSERGQGEGRSKKEAEQAAARDAWHRLAGELQLTGESR